MRGFPTIATFCVFFAFGLAAKEVATPNDRCAAKKCTEIATCNEAKYLLNECGLTLLDRDGDGIPCEALCKGGKGKEMKKPTKNEKLKAQILKDLTESLDNIQAKYPPINEEDRAQDEELRKEVLEAAEKILNESLNF